MNRKVKNPRDKNKKTNEGNEKKELIYIYATRNTTKDNLIGKSCNRSTGQKCDTKNTKYNEQTKVTTRLVARERWEILSICFFVILIEGRLIKKQADFVRLSSCMNALPLWA